MAAKFVVVELIRKGLRALNDCPAEPMIPIFLGGKYDMTLIQNNIVQYYRIVLLLVAAVDLILVMFLRMLKKVFKFGCWKRYVDADKWDRFNVVYGNFIFIFVDIFQSIFSFVWIICGSVWVFRCEMFEI